jgi:hypothetical protein
MQVARREAVLSVVLAGVTAIACAGLFAAAALVPAPPVMIPLVIIVCISCPMAAAWHLPASFDTLRRRKHAKALAELRRELDCLPETQHPFER